MANAQRGGAFYGADPYRSREGLSTRPVANQDEIQLRIDPIHGDLDEEITGLHSKISRLKNVAQEINTEAKFQNDFVTQLQMTMIKAQAGVKNNMRRLNRSIIQQGSNHLYMVIMFALACFFLVYLYSKFSRDLIRSPTEDEFNDNVSKFKETYASVLGAIDYVVDLLENWKERFVSAWTDSVMHFDTHTSNRAESTHAALKKWLDTSRGDLLQNWEVIHNLLENQITEIQATFNRSRNNIKHFYRDAIYSEIRGIIASQALDMLAKEIKRSEWISGEKMCGCVLRRTCGLPCAHELKEMVLLRKGHIPLSSIHPRWRKLDFLDMDLPKGSVDITPELVALRKRSEQLSEHQNILLIKKLRELADPKTTFLQVLRKKMNVRGRPSKKAKKTKDDTKRLASRFESAQTQEEKKASENMQKKPRKKRGRPQKKPTEMCREPLENLEMQVMKNIPELQHKWSPHLIELDPRICDYIEMYEPVKGDGHCGYRSIAFLRGYDEIGGWERVRSELWKELMTHHLEYCIVFGTERVNLLKLNLECRKFSTMERNEWFDLPDMGTLAANAYNCDFVCLAPGSASLTYLPWRTPPSSPNSEIMTIGHIWQNQHYVPLRLARNAPLPPVLPGWEKICTPTAAPWLLVITEQLNKWDREIKKKVNAYYVSGRLLVLFQTCSFRICFS